MANEDVKTNVSITLTGKEAENQIEHLKSKAEELRKKLQEAQKALNPDPKEIRRLEQELKAVEKTLSSVTRESKKYEDVLKNLNGSTIKQLRQAQRQLNAEIQKLKPGTLKWVAISSSRGSS